MTTMAAPDYNAPTIREPFYDVEMRHLADQLTPMALRTSMWQALMQAILKPVETLCYDYRTFRAAKRQRLKHNGQVRLLERICNYLMVGSYNMNAPLIYLDEPEPVNEFLVSPNGQWELQNSIHYDQNGKDEWDELNPDPLEAPERYSILHDRSGHISGLGFIVHVSVALAPDAPDSDAKLNYNQRGGEVTLASIIDTYKLAGKRYTIVRDWEQDNEQTP